MRLPQVELKKILYATDLSQSAHHAFAHAVSLADRYCASITLLHVLHGTPGYVENLIGTDQWQKIKQHHYDDAREALIGKRREHSALREVLHKLCEDLRADENLPDFTTDEILVREGNPAEEILATAEDKGCDLIVMGTHGVGGIVEAMVGSTTRKVLRHARIPVLVVRLPAKG